MQHHAWAHLRPSNVLVVWPSVAAVRVSSIVRVAPMAESWPLPSQSCDPTEPSHRRAKFCVVLAVGYHKLAWLAHSLTNKRAHFFTATPCHHMHAACQTVSSPQECPFCRKRPIRDLIDDGAKHIGEAARIPVGPMSAATLQKLQERARERMRREQQTRTAMGGSAKPDLRAGSSGDGGWAKGAKTKMMSLKELARLAVLQCVCVALPPVHHHRQYHPICHHRSAITTTTIVFIVSIQS